MSSSGLKRFFRTIGFRISLWHSALLIFSGLLFLIGVHFLVSFFFTTQDYEKIRQELMRLSGVLSSQGAAGIEKEISVQRGDANYFIRLADKNNETIASSADSDFEDYDLDQIENSKPEQGKWFGIQERYDGEYKILGRESLDISTITSNGMILQVGKTAEERMDLEAKILLITGILIIPLLLAVATFLSHRALHPLRFMIATVESIQAGKLSSRVPITGTGDELDVLAKLFNSMLERIEKLIQGMQDSLDNVAHDLRTPITRLRATAEIALQTNGSKEGYRDALADCMEETEEILSMLETLMDISEAQTGAMKLRQENVNVSNLIEDSIDLYRYVAEDRGLTIEARCNGDVFVTVDARRIRQALANLVDNAVKYTERGGKIVVEAHKSDGQAIIAVSDTGSGIPHDDLPRIWERLYRTENAQAKKGIGLGLSLVRAIVYSHGGKVRAESEVDKGSVFTIQLPLSTEN